MKTDMVTKPCLSEGMLNSKSNGGLNIPLSMRWGQIDIPTEENEYF